MNTRFQSIFSNWLAQARLTQGEFAARLGKKQSQVAAWNSGKEKIPAKHLEAVSQLLGVPVPVLCLWQGELPEEFRDWARNNPSEVYGALKDYEPEKA